VPEDDWRPKLTRIEDPIADDYWRYITPQGERRISRLTVGRPVHFPQERCWYTPVMIEGYLAKVTPVFGEGPVDSLMNAMTLVKQFHGELLEIVPGAKSRGGAKRTTQRKVRGKAATSKVPRKRSHSAGNDR
jgi:hypothetical protein